MIFNAKFKISKRVPLKASFKVNEQNPIRAIFKLDVKPSKVSQLENDLNYQTKDEVDTAIQVESDRINTRIDAIDADLSNTITSIAGDELINVTRIERHVQLHSTSFVFEQGIASNEWIIQHNLNKRPTIDLVDSSGRSFEAVKEYIDDNQVIVRLESPTTGLAYLN